MMIGKLQAIKSLDGTAFTNNAELNHQSNLQSFWQHNDRNCKISRIAFLMNAD